jgi:cobalt-zinc-cadmium efflux system protein
MLTMAAEHAHHAHSHAHSHARAGAHDHPHRPSASPERRLIVALVLTLTFMVVEAVAGWLVHSLALLSDAGHMLADAGALGLALMAQVVASRPRTLSRTYGYRRAETLAALANGIVLCMTAIWVFAEGITRWRVPAAIDAGPMLAVAIGGLVFNLVAGLVLSGGHSHNANTRAALAHVISDALGSVAAIVAAGLVLAFGWQRADVVASVAISVLILLGAFRLVTETVSVLMESVPSGVVLEDLEQTIRATPGVADLHDLHAWTISDGFDAVTVHVVLDGAAHGTEVAHEVGERIRRVHHVMRVTVQPEAPPFSPALHPPQKLLRNRKA